MPLNESAGFVAAGFEVSESLHLLERRITAVDRHRTRPPDGITLRRARSSDLGAVLTVDGRGFGEFWRLDSDGITDARHATTYARFRVALHGDALVGYAITGRQGRLGYLQRLAVDPSMRRAGVGSALVNDGVHWLARWRSESVLVNTQVSNTSALALYQSLHFALKPEGLHVLSASLP